MQNNQPLTKPTHSWFIFIKNKTKDVKFTTERSSANQTTTIKKTQHHLINTSEPIKVRFQKDCVGWTCHYLMKSWLMKTVRTFKLPVNAENRRVLKPQQPIISRPWRRENVTAFTCFSAGHVSPAAARHAGPAASVYISVNSHHGARPIIKHDISL